MMYWLSLYLIFSPIITVFSSSEFAPIVKTDFGQIQGLIVKLDDNSNVFLYEGIKYGKAKRFEKATFIEPWQGVYNATRRRDACPQPGKHVRNESTPFIPSIIGSSTNTMSEDCLYLNVWRPEHVSTPLPVMVWIHGGTFTTGTIFDDAFNAQYMVSMGSVIVVAINYRLGPFGFLYGAHDDAPGNQGLHDQILALIWVQKEIHYFGGNPDQVTVFGESAGSMALGALVLSPLTKNLFHRAIMQSGSPNSYLGSCSKENALIKTYDFAKRLDCDGWFWNMTEILDCLRNKTIEQILEASKDDLMNSRLMIPIYGDDLMPLNPAIALKKKQFNPVDLMFGITRNEGSGFVASLLPILNPDIKHPIITIPMVKTVITLMMVFFNQTNVREISDFYSHDLNASNVDDLRIAIADAFGDYTLVCPTILYGEHFARGVSIKNNNYYSYRLMLPLLSGPFSCRGWEGVCHGEDVAYLFMVPTSRKEHTPEEVKLSNDMIKTWTKFAWTGHPGSLDQHEWLQAIDHNKGNDSYVSYMSLDPNHYQMVENYFKIKCDQFWGDRIMDN